MGSLAPGDIGPKAKPQNKASGSKKNSSKDIWDAEEVVEGSEYDCLHDPRPQPGYEIIYKQAVTSEDMFLQMGNKTPATASCEDMIVKIHLPETKMSDVELDVKEKFLDLRTPKYFLGLFLPHPVDHKKGKAQWDSRSQTLHVTLRMVRDLDLFNF
ncbi:protein PIH1D3-like [Pomacea canaliculata]|uniref:protein PIH1D3-like n=1 Tax=Pomacea canaliculata TaxID=400727 RepID=UPI000D738566|nr:protein PIH1D3-like [Pomacea canaliculata]XP_025087238.1 protein PIH1D3-like [Pomacea canaliculata]XP_025087239.1 protein PIH1D3-like [Pomacea canaliculata]